MRSQTNTAQMKEQNKIPEKKLNKVEITKLSYAEFKTLVIRMLKELTEYNKNIREEMKFTLSEIKKNLQGNKREWMNMRIKSMIWNIRKKKALNQNIKKKKEFLKKRIE